MSIKNKRTLSGIGMAVLFVIGGAGNLFTATLLLIISATCLYFGKETEIIEMATKKVA